MKLAEMLQFAQTNQKNKALLTKYLEEIARRKFPHGNAICQLAFGSSGVNCPDPWEDRKLLGRDLSSCRPFCDTSSRSILLRDLNWAYTLWTHRFSENTRVPMIPNDYKTNTDDIDSMSIEIYSRKGREAELFFDSDINKTQIEGYQRDIHTRNFATLEEARTFALQQLARIPSQTQIGFHILFGAQRTIKDLSLFPVRSGWLTASPLPNLKIKIRFDPSQAKDLELWTLE